MRILFLATLFFLFVGCATTKLEERPKGQTALVDSVKTHGFWTVETRPELLKSVKPVYPKEAREKNLEGQVLLRFTINADGSVSNPHVWKSTGSEIFHKAAIEAILQYRFKPAQHGEKAVPVWMTQVIGFRLH